MKVRWLMKSDIKQVCDIEEVKNAWWAWSDKQINENLKEKNVIGIVVASADVVTGYCLYKLSKNKLHILKLEAYNSESEVLLLSKLVDKINNNEHKRDFITWDVESYRLERQLWLKASGFAAIAVKKNFFALQEEDSYYFLYKKDQNKTFVDE